jgi:hypothetical protein
LVRETVQSGLNIFRANRMFGKFEGAAAHPPPQFLAICIRSEVFFLGR